MPTEPVLPKNFLRPAILLLLREDPAHGYDLIARLRPLGFARSDPGGVYRTLRGLEEEGLVHSGWAASSSGPARRMYNITRSGTEELHRLATALDAGRQSLDAFLSRYSEFVALPRERQGAPASR
jgi:PadR family transcriptional regulator, regulatory protein PadR